MRQKIKVAPSVGRVLNMPHDILIEHYNLIQLKKSNLSANQRRMVQARVEFNIGNKKILQAQIDDSMTFIKSMK